MPRKSTSKPQPYTGGYCGQDSHASFVNRPLNPVAEAMLDQTETPTSAASPRLDTKSALDVLATSVSQPKQ